MAAQTKHRRSDSDIADEISELHDEALRLTLIVLAVLAIYVHYALSAITNTVDPRRFGLMCGIVLAVILTYWALRFGPALAAGLLTAILSVLLGAGVLAFQAPLLAFWFSPVVILSGAFLGWSAGITGAVVASGVIGAASLTHVMPGDLALYALLLAWVSVLICWVLSHPTRTALDWAWHNYLHAVHLTEELRDRQAQVERTLKSLAIAYQRLEQLNLELARARQDAEQARRLKAEFAAAISHELRTPLNLIIGFSEMMVTTPRAYGQPLPESYRGDLEAIYRNACHLSNLVDDVLDLSQIEADRMGLQKEQLRLAPVVDEAVTTIARLYAAKGLSLEVEVPLDLPPVYADRTRIRQVLINLLNNAVRFTNQGGVTIRAWSEGMDVVVAVRDTGIGIAPEHLPAVFEEFRQIHVLGEQRVIGSGLGLAVSKRFVELHGGSMWVESSPGQGSVFYFSLPRCGSVIASPVPPRSDRWPPPTSSDSVDTRTIVVLDREGEAGRLFARHLDGYQVVIARSAEQARRQIERSIVHAVVVTGSHGPPDPTTLHRISEVFPDVPVAACSLKTRKVTPRALGVADCLTKPITREQIRLALRRLGRQIRTILIADDDPEMIRLLGRLVQLTSRRYTILEARNGQEALTLLETRPPDAVLLDLVMPDLSGDDLLRRMRENPALRDIPVILVTGHGLGDETVTADLLSFSQRGGLSIRELMRCLRTGIEAVQRPQAAVRQHLEQGIAADRLGEEIRGAEGEGKRAFVNN
ncbi:MAG: response regulator [Chloroflexi bacterium]|nr:response regulator [Chloroflexota bacterium]